MKKILSLLLSVCLVVTLIPVISFAAESGQGQDDENMIPVESQIDETAPETPEQDPGQEAVDVTPAPEESPEEAVQEPQAKLKGGATLKSMLVQGKWEKPGDYWKFKLSETGEYIQGNIEKEIYNGKYYFFDADGNMQTGIQRDSINNKKYYFTPGVEGAIPEENNTYGQREAGWINASTYGESYFNPDMKTGWQTIGGYTYYLNPNKEGAKTTGWLTLSGKKYYFDTQGHMVKNELRTINGKKYYFNAQGQMQTGLTKVGTKTYFFSTSSATLGQAQTGLQTIGGYKYYFSKSSQTLGEMMTGWLKIYSDTAKRAYFEQSTGRLHTGWLSYKGYKYYLDARGIAKTGWQTIGGNKYYFRTSGTMYKGWLTYNKNKYYFDTTSGKMKKGWLKYKGNYYFLDTASGKMKKGWLKYKNKKYYLNTKTGVRFQNGLKKISGTYYYFNKSNGVMKANGCVKISGKLYYFKKSGKAQMKKGWFKGSDNKKRYSLGNGVVATGTKKVGATWYVFSKSNGTITRTIGDDIDYKVQSKSSDTNNVIAVYRAKYQVRVYKGSKGNWSRIKKFDCAIGKNSTPTPTGTFKITKMGKTNKYTVNGVTTRYWYYCYFFNQKQGIHSGLYYDNTGEPGRPYDTRLNVKSTSGGVRISYDNAKWIYDNISVGTTVVVY